MEKTTSYWRKNGRSWHDYGVGIIRGRRDEWTGRRHYGDIQTGTYENQLNKDIRT